MALSDYELWRTPDGVRHLIREEVKPAGVASDLWRMEDQVVRIECQECPLSGSPDQREVGDGACPHCITARDLRSPLSVKAVAALKGVPPSAVYTAIKRGELSPQQISGRVWVLRRSAVEMWDPHRQRGPRGPHPRSKPRGRP